MPKSRGWGSIAFAVLLGLALAAWGAVRIRNAPSTRGLDDARTVAIREAVAAAGDSTPVRLQGVLVTIPPLIAPDGESYALQALVITHGSGTPGSAGRTTDYRRIAPAQIFLTDGDSSVAIDPTGLDLAPVPILADGRTQRDGVLPRDLVAHLVPGFTELPPRGGGDVVLRAIESGVPVVAYGTLVLSEGVPTLVRPANGDPYVISSLSFTEVHRMIADRDRTSRSFGWAMVVVGALIAVAALAFGLRRS